MVVLFADRKEKSEKEIIEILSKFGADYISDKKISADNGNFTVISEYKKTCLEIKEGIAVMLGKSDRFENQFLPEGIIGICESDNLTALKVFRSNKIPVITCGMNQKSTVTLSSLSPDSFLLTVQRNIFNRENSIETGEYKLNISGNYSPFSLMASAVILMLKSQKQCPSQ